jgi:hypothetical protein
VYLSSREAVFSFKGHAVERLVGKLVNDASSAGMLEPWVELTDNPPRRAASPDRPLARG